MVTICHGNYLPTLKYQPVMSVYLWLWRWLKRMRIRYSDQMVLIFFSVKTWPRSAKRLVALCRPKISLTGPIPTIPSRKNGFLMLYLKGDFKRFHIIMNQAKHRKKYFEKTYIIRKTIWEERTYGQEQNHIL